MKIYENHKNTGKRTKNSCGYCRQEGHNRTECPQVARDWRYWELYQIPPYYVTYWKAQTKPAGWAKWYEDCRNTYALQQAKKTKASAPVVRSAPKCGFCGGTDHNRRNCNKMKNFLADCYKANENWRRRVYKVLVQDHGFDVGAAVNLTLRHQYYTQTGESHTKHVGIITHINWDNLNIMTAFEGSWDAREKYSQHIEVKAMVEGEDITVSLRPFVRENKLNQTITEHCSQSYRNWGAYEFHSIIGRSETPLSEEWVTSYREAFDFLVKRRSFEKLKEDGIVALIDKWK